MADNIDATSASSFSDHFSLLCQEDEEASLNEEGEKEKQNGVENLVEFGAYFGSEKELDEYFENLVRSERASSRCGNCFVTTTNWLRSARLYSIEWILNTRAIFGFKFQTAYSSISYLDQFLSLRSIDEGKIWAVRLLSVACLSVAAKMEETRVPALSEFRVQDFDFESKVIQRMELLVLSTLEWKLSSITPLDYLPYFINKFHFDEFRPKGLVSKALEITMSAIKEIQLMEHRPSIIAAAAVLVASDNGPLEREKVEMNLNMISSFGSLEYENVVFCYKAMQKTEMDKLKTPKSVISPNPSWGSIDNPDIHGSFISGSGTKRRLAYSENDRNSPVKKTTRPN